MKTIEEQLTEMRTAYVRTIYQGQPETIINAATKDVHRMNFNSLEEFKQFVNDQFQEDPNRQATDEELDPIMDLLGLGGVERDTRTSDEKELDEIMKHIGQ